MAESIEHVIRTALKDEYGDRDVEAMVTRHWNSLDLNDPDRRRFGDRSYWSNLSFTLGAPPADAIVTSGGDYVVRGSNYIVWS